MKKDRSVALMIRYSIILILALFISACSAKLIDIDKSLPRLNLSQEQLEVVKPKMEAVRDITDIYNAKKEVFEEEFSNMRGSGMKGNATNSGKRAEFREKMKEFRKQRETYLSAIETRVAEIKTVLDEEQLAVFEKMKLPELDMPEMPGERGQGMRRGGGGGKGGGGRGGGGRRGGGGIF